MLLTAAVLFFKLNLVYVILIGIFMGLIFGKVFCRWICPMGFIMELMMTGSSDQKHLQLYNYHKLGCPIAWISGLFNKFSIFKVRKDRGKCTNCGICDKNCYISSLNSSYSLHKDGRKNPSIHYSCSKCLACVEKCPAKSLKYSI